MRLDYNNSKLDLDVWWVNYILENGRTLWSLLREQSDISIIANSYKLWTGRDTWRIMNNPWLNLGERMALVHSAMMQQGCNVLWRNENRIFGYHYTLISDFPESRFATLQHMFNDFEEY